MIFDDPDTFGQRALGYLRDHSHTDDRVGEIVRGGTDLKLTVKPPYG